MLLLFSLKNGGKVSGTEPERRDKDRRGKRDYGEGEKLLTRERGRKTKERG